MIVDYVQTKYVNDDDRFNIPTLVGYAQQCAPARNSTCSVTDTDLQQPKLPLGTTWSMPYAAYLHSRP